MELRVQDDEFDLFDLKEKVLDLEKKINEIEMFLCINHRYPKRYDELYLEGKKLGKKI